MRDAAFSVAEAAAVLDEDEFKVRDWLRRTPICPIGSKPKGRIWFTGYEIFALAVARDLVEAGYLPHRAMLTAYRLATAQGDMRRAVPFRDEFCLVPLPDDFEAEPIRGHWSSLAGAKRAGIFLPLWTIYSDVQAACAALYEEASQ